MVPEGQQLLPQGGLAAHQGVEEEAPRLAQGGGGGVARLCMCVMCTMYVRADIVYGEEAPGLAQGGGGGAARLVRACVPMYVYVLCVQCM